MSRPLYSAHSRALTIAYAELESVSLAQREAFVGSAGSVIERTNASGFRYYAHQFYGTEGTQRERYLAGPTGDPKADLAADALRSRIREQKDLVPTLRMLGREGFNLVDAKTYATAAVLHNHGVFAAGAMLVGSHAYGVLLDRMGARATPYTTEDIDIARRAKLAFDNAFDMRLLDMLRESGIDFVEVPSLDKKQPATSFKEKGRARFQVDLLAPARGETMTLVAVPELNAHATGLPFLDYLVVESQMAMLMAREGCCAVRVPLPERFAIHKLVVSRLRAGRSAKSEKDVQQACVLCAVLAERHPGALESAIQTLPRRATKHFRAALESVRPILEPAAPRAWRELTDNPRVSAP